MFRLATLCGDPDCETGTWACGKTFHVYEAQTLQFRFEVFDILNHPNWNNPSTDPTSGSFGMVTGKSGDSRQLQLALKYIF